MPSDRPWLLVGFDERVTGWIRDERPPPDRIRTVLRWIDSRAEDPFAGAQFVPDLGDRLFDILFAHIPGTMGIDGRVVTCTYLIFRADWTVECSMITTASWPV